MFRQCKNESELFSSVKMPHEPDLQEIRLYTARPQSQTLSAFRATLGNESTLVELAFCPLAV